MKKITSKREIKKFLRKHINLRNNYLLVLMVLSISFLVIYSSYALFVVSKTKMGAYNITAGTINVELTAEALDTNKQITVNANDSQEFEVTLTNKSSVPAKVILYYKMINPTSPSEDIMVGYKTDTAFPPISTGSILSSSGLSDDHSSYTLIIKNDSSESTTIEIGVKVGLSSPTLTLANDEYLISQAISLEDETLVEGNPLDWEVSDEPNATGGYTLLSFLGDLENSNSVIVDQDYYTDANLRTAYKDIIGIESTSEMANRNAYTINIPSVVAGKNITEMGFSLFTAIDFTTEEPSFIETYFRIKEVKIPEGIVKINGLEGDTTSGAFMYNVHLATVTMPSTLKDIGPYAFYICDLTSLILPSALETISNGAFAINRISSVTIPETVISIGYGVFGENPLTTLVFAGVSTDGSGNDTSSLTTLGIDYGGIFDVYNVNHIIYLPSSLTNVEKHVFSCDYRESLCTFYINQTSIPETYDISWAGNYARKYVLNGSGGYTCVENCP